MPRHTALNDKHHYICTDAKNPAVIPGSTNPSELNQNECILQRDKVKNATNKFEAVPPHLQ